VPANLRIDGLTALQAALRQLPEDLTREGAVIVRAQADAAAGQMAAAYPIRRGGLRAGLRVETRADDRGSASAVVVNRARHAYLYEKGTKSARHWKNGKSTGTMPAGHVFIPIAIQRRRMMTAALVDLVRRAGLDVTE
jgi:hypothetical protein